MTHPTPKEIKCPKCGSETVLRTAKKGQNAGEKYFVCMYYPECKGKVITTTENKQSTEQRESDLLKVPTGMLNFLQLDKRKTEEEQPKKANTRSGGNKLLMVLLAIGIGIAIQVLLAPLAKIFGAIGILFGTVLGFVVMGYLIYRWVT